MWYRLSQQNIGGGAIKAAPLLPVNDGGNPLEQVETYIPQYSGYEALNTELRFLLEEMGQTLENYYEMSADQQKELWDILVKRPHHIGGSESNGELQSGSFGDQLSSNSQRRHSPYHHAPENTTIEEQLDGSRHENNNVEPINMQSQAAQTGKPIQTGIGQPAAFASGKGAALFMGDLPANQTLI
jgi:hypothetical protein